MEIAITAAIAAAAFAVVFSSIALGIGLYLLHQNNPNRGRVGP